MLLLKNVFAEFIMIKHFIKNELQNWKAIEVLWIIIACSIILSLSIYWKENIIGIV